MKVSAPCAWPMVPLKHLARVNAHTLPEDTDPDFEFDYVDIGLIDRGRLVGPPVRMDFARAPSRARRLVRRGDTAVSTVRTYLRAVWPVSGDPSQLVVSTGFAVVSPGNTVNPRFMSWWLQSDPFVEEVVARSVGVSYPAINPGELGAIKAPIPPLSDQQVIADFLDAQASRIDALIAKKRQMLELIDDRYRTEIDLLTGLGPTVPVRRVAAHITSGPRGWSDQVGNVGSPFIRSANLQRNELTLRADNLLRVDVPNSAEAARSQVQVDDTVVGITGANTAWVGLVGQEHDRGYVSQHVALVRPSIVAPEWLAFSLFSRRSQQQLMSGQYGGTKQQLGLHDLASLVIHVPSPDDQESAIRRLRESEQRTTNLVDKLGRQVALLQEHRQALITAAVTGEMEIPGVRR